MKLQHLEDFKGYNKIINRRNLKRGICADNDTLCTKDDYKKILLNFCVGIFSSFMTPKEVIYQNIW